MITEAIFLNKNEYCSTRKLFTECFGDDGEFMGEFYGVCDEVGRCSGKVDDAVIAVIKDGGRPVAMVQYILVKAVSKDEERQSKAVDLSTRKEKPDAMDISEDGRKIPYIMGVCTLPEYRHRGLMDKLMKAVIDRIEQEGYPWCFLIAVDRNIYRHLGFAYDWKLSERERELLYADDGLDTASAKLLSVRELPDVSLFPLS
ncbi:MAG: GNAT family N-acetyltransferase [Eubacteriales bacterium]|nr:GNAT family N-acetyltransferase [Eubacteriales bacterium]